MTTHGVTAATEPFAQAAPSRETLHLWGAPAAGKTGLLGALYATSKSREPDRWEAHPKDCRDAYTQEQLLDANEQLLDRAVAKTDVRKDGYRPLEFLLRQYRRGAPTGDSLRLSIVDPAGEYSTRTELGLTEHGRSLFARVAHGGGLLWLFSAAPDGAPSTLDRLVVLRHLVALLEAAGGPQLGIPVGLCLSKVDALPPDRREAALADPRAALLAHLGPTTFTWFEAACPRLKCFAISSAGTEPGRVRPVGLLPTLSWFAAEIGASHAPDVRPESSTPRAPERPVVPPSDVFSTIEVPSARPTAATNGGARGMLASLAARFASAGQVPTGDAPRVDAPRVDAPRDDAVFARTPMYTPPAMPAVDAHAAPTMAMPAVSRDALRDAPPVVTDAPAPVADDVTRDDVVGDDGETPELPIDPLRARVVRAAVGAALALGAMGAGAWAGRAAILAASQRWQPPDAPPAAVRGVRAPVMPELQPDRGGIGYDPNALLANPPDRSDGDVEPDAPEPPIDVDSLLRALREESEARRGGALRFDTITVPEPRTPPPYSP
ncbi:hypothetical protein [Roseisolibacter agri]|uniref:Uncharacterized protein n=1 Tax=Roseisolibacter agri TaxID=2014610 RepID=A0AA37Q6X9_9BACT|nr:hypothetical protein [Roseisolibacter agri]GLC25822.1 hypothetical protein rosag_23350 [Roseisolibacter agri]